MLIWTVGICAGLAGVVAGAIVARLCLQPHYKYQLRSEFSRLFLTSEGDQNAILIWARRYYGQILFQYNVDKFEKIYFGTLEYLVSLENANDIEIKSAFEKLTARIPNYGEFESFLLKDYVVYDYRDDMFEIERLYKDALMLQILKQGLTDFGFKFDAERVRTAARGIKEARGKRYSDFNDMHFNGYTKQYKDTVLLSRIVRAVKEFDAFKSHCFESQKNSKDRSVYRGSFFEIRRIEHFAELRYGINFTHTNEYAIFGKFFDDDIYLSFFRSDANFEKEEPLDYISGTISIDMFDAYFEKKELKNG